MHTNENLHKYMYNGSVLKEHNIGIYELIQYRLHVNPKPIYWYCGFREPIAWYLSLSNELGIPLEQSLIANIVENIHSKEPWTDYLYSTQFNLINQAINSDISTIPFDKTKGVTVKDLPRVKLFLYKIDCLKELEKEVRNIDSSFSEFALGQVRITQSQEYKDFYQYAKYDEKTLAALYSSQWVKYFYTEEQINKILIPYTKSYPKQLLRRLKNLF